MPGSLAWISSRLQSELSAAQVKRFIQIGLLAMVFLSMAACAGAHAASSEVRAPEEIQTAILLTSPPTYTPGLPTATHEPAPPAIPTRTPASPTTVPAVLLPTAATVCPEGICDYPGALLFSLPVAAPANIQVDGSYRFGSTQNKKRDPHHGVEFLNAAGTPVLAAGDGVVVVAGTDAVKNAPPSYSPYTNFYGNVVVIEHQPGNVKLEAIPDFNGPVYTLYAHLSEILVEEGQEVSAGQEIGKVGMTGGATGNHLHFEVRLGENTYAAAHNPELWLQGKAPSLDSAQGALAGRVVDPAGRPVAVKDIVLEHLLDGADSASDWEIYLDSYEEKALLGRSPWGESFGAGSLAPGWYRISFPRGGLQSQVVQVFPGKLTVVTFQVEG
jgi:murein DD-endopeptidase MepM/ murein hydrolase activator NlpD